LPSPVDHRSVIKVQDEERDQLEEVLPEQNSHVKVNVAYVDLAIVPGETHVTHTVVVVNEVSAVAPVQAGVGLALIHLLLTASRRMRVRYRNRGKKRDDTQHQDGLSLMNVLQPSPLSWVYF
jgi:hypothetical protein